jgi:hypothetical protein
VSKGCRVFFKAARKKLEMISKLVVSLLCLTACLSAPMPASSQEIRDGQTLLTAMHDRYKDSWYESVFFKENAITLNPDGTSKSEVWDEALQLPGKLRINKGPSSEGNGFVFADGTVSKGHGLRHTPLRSHAGGVGI